MSEQASFQSTNSKGVTYNLNCKDITLRGGRVQRIYYFTKDVRDTSCGLPEGWEVIESARNGFLTIRRIRG